METCHTDIHGFESRSKSVFDSLLVLESNHKAKETQYIGNEQTLQHHEQELTEDEFNFKLPCITSYKRQVSETSNQSNKHHKKTPDHIANPDKWTKYSLEDVDSSQMSQSANYFAAMNFLKKPGMGEDFQKLADNIVFNKPIGANKMEVTRVSHTEKTYLDKLNEEEDEGKEEEDIEEDMEKMEINEKPDNMFKRKTKSKNIRSMRRSTDEEIDLVDTKELLVTGVNNSELELDEPFKDYKADSSDENEFGDDFDKY